MDGLGSGSAGSAGSCPISTAASVLKEATSLGITFSVHGGLIQWKAARPPPDDVLGRLRAHKPELIEILAGDRCRYCGERIARLGPVGVVFADRTAAHVACFEQAEAERLLAAAERALAGVVSTSDHGELLRAGDEA
jgi:hypothetical protein